MCVRFFLSFVLVPGFKNHEDRMVLARAAYWVIWKLESRQARLDCFKGLLKSKVIGVIA